VVKLFTYTSTLSSKHRKRHNIFQITLSNNIQTLKNLLTNSQGPKETITTFSFSHFFTFTPNQTAPESTSFQFSDWKWVGLVLVGREIGLNPDSTFWFSLWTKSFLGPSPNENEPKITRGPDPTWPVGHSSKNLTRL